MEPLYLLFSLFCSQLEKDLLDILAELPKREKIQERSSLQRRIDLLLSLGCTMDQIQDNVEALKLSEQVILRRATMLKVLRTCDLFLCSKLLPVPFPKVTFLSLNCQCKKTGCILRENFFDTNVANTCTPARYYPTSISTMRRLFGQRRGAVNSQRPRLLTNSFCYQYVST